VQQNRAFGLASDIVQDLHIMGDNMLGKHIAPFLLRKNSISELFSSQRRDSIEPAILFQDALAFLFALCVTNNHLVLGCFKSLFNFHQNF
jgi:hypothetical protein